MVETTAPQIETRQQTFTRGLIPETTVTEELTTHKIKLERNGITYEITSFGSRDKRIGDFLEEQTENIFRHDTAWVIAHDEYLNEYLKQLVNPALGINNLVEAIEQSNVWTDKNLRVGQLMMDCSTAYIVDDEGYHNVNDIMCLAFRSSDHIRVVTLVHDNAKSDAAKVAFNDAVEWIVPADITGQPPLFPH